MTDPAHPEDLNCNDDRDESEPQALSSVGEESKEDSTSQSLADLVEPSPSTSQNGTESRHENAVEGQRQDLQSTSSEDDKEKKPATSQSFEAIPYSLHSQEQSHHYQNVEGGRRRGFEAASSSNEFLLSPSKDVFLTSTAATIEDTSFDEGSYDRQSLNISADSMSMPNMFETEEMAFALPQTINFKLNSSDSNEGQEESRQNGIEKDNQEAITDDWSHVNDIDLQLFTSFSPDRRDVGALAELYPAAPELDNFFRMREQPAQSFSRDSNISTVTSEAHGAKRLPMSRRRPTLREDAIQPNTNINDSYSSMSNSSSAAREVEETKTRPRTRRRPAVQSEAPLPDTDVGESRSSCSSFSNDSMTIDTSGTRGGRRTLAARRRPPNRVESMQSATTRNDSQISSSLIHSRRAVTHVHELMSSRSYGHHYPDGTSAYTNFGSNIDDTTRREELYRDESVRHNSTLSATDRVLAPGRYRIGYVEHPNERRARGLDGQSRSGSNLESTTRITSQQPPRAVQASVFSTLPREVNNRREWLRIMHLHIYQFIFSSDNWEEVVFEYMRAARSTNAAQQVRELASSRRQLTDPEEIRTWIRWMEWLCNYSNNIGPLH